MSAHSCAGPWIGSFFPISADGSPATVGLSPYGLAIMVVSIAGILTLVVRCYATLLRSGRDQEGT